MEEAGRERLQNEELKRELATQKKELEMIIRRLEGTVDKRNAEIQDLKTEYKEEFNRRRESGIPIEALEMAQREAVVEADQERMEMEESERELAMQERELEMMIRRLEDTIDKRNAEIQDLETEYKEEFNRRRESGIRIQGLEKAQREAVEDADKGRMQIEELKRELAAVQRHPDKTTRLLKTWTEVLTAAQASLTTADECSRASSGADVAQLVAQLNDDIDSCSAIMAEAVTEPDAVEGIPDEGIMEKLIKELSGFE
ncbi:hypothetical protein H1R20_g14831, partial [Candolleomyces eurysporus]